MFLSNSVLIDVLREATQEELISITSLIENEKVDKSLSISKIRKEICEIGGHSLVNFFRGDGVGYLEILYDISKELKTKNVNSYDDEAKYYDDVDELKYDRQISKEMGIKYAKELEEKIILKLLEMSYKEMTAQEKKTFDEQMNQIARKHDNNTNIYLTGGAGLIALGNLGGFATYTFLTTFLSTISMGSLGFGAYTVATSLLSVIMGPVGWTSLGAIAILTLGSSNTKKLIPIVAIIGAIRQRVDYEKTRKIKI